MGSSCWYPMRQVCSQVLKIPLDTGWRLVLVSGARLKRSPRRKREDSYQESRCVSKQIETLCI